MGNRRKQRLFLTGISF